MMNALVRALGTVLRLVGISSPEDTRPKAKSSAGLPSWRKAENPESSTTKKPQA
jgi:hypothetical protein